MQARKVTDFKNTPESAYIEKVNDILKDTPRTYFIETYGCQMNVRDSQTLSGMFEKMGYTAAKDIESADAIIFNTCCVREGAEDRLTGNLGRLLPLKEKKPGTLIMICGCMMQEAGKADYIKRRFKFVDIVFGTHNAQALPRLMYRVLSEKSRAFEINEDLNIIEDMPVKRENEFSAWVNIMYGCNNFCSYCIVPYVRGRERSRKSEDIIKEAQELVKSGVKEITLLGQNVNSYGLGLDEISFPQLLRKLSSISGLERIRFMTSHPKDLSDELINAMAECDNVCKYIHLPVQSGSDRILKLMNRRYSRSDYFTLIEKLRSKIPDIAISTDIIVGFPTETEQDFADTLDLYSRVCFNSAFTFIYSKRTGTPAAVMEDQVEESVAKDRLTRLIALGEECTLKANAKYLNNTYPVLVEGISKRDSSMVSGRDSSARMISFKGSSSLIGKTVNVKITQVKLNTLLGERVDN